MTLPALVALLKLYFSKPVPPSNDEAASSLGMSGHSNTSLSQVTTTLWNHEVLCWQHRQSSRRLSGVVEADATSLWRDESGKNSSLQVLGLMQRPPDKATSEDARQVHLYSLGIVSAKAGGKPPPESKERILRCKAMEDIAPQTKGWAKTVLVTDGAPAYVGLARQFGLAHLSCNHSQGEFNVVKRRGPQPSLDVNTGSIDGFWARAKRQFPHPCTHSCPMVRSTPKSSRVSKGTVGGGKTRVKI